MTQASENVAKHKYWRVMTDRIMIFPLILLLGWTAMIALGYTFTAAVLFAIACCFAGGIIWGVKQQKTNMKKLDEAMEAIRDLPFRSEGVSLLTGFCIPMTSLQKCKETLHCIYTPNLHLFTYQ